MRGQFSKAARVEWDHPELAPVMLEVAGRIRYAVEVSPASLFLEGFPEERKTAAVTLTNHEDTPLRVAGVRCSLPEVETAIEEIEPGQKYRLTATRRVDLPRRSIPRGLVEVTLEDPARPKVDIPVYVVVKQKVSVNRGAVVFRGAPAGAPPKEVTVLVDKYGDQEFRIKGVTCDLPYVTVETVALPYQRNIAASELKFDLKAERPAQPFEGKVVIETTDPEFSRLTLAVMGPGRAPAVAAVQK